MGKVYTTDELNNAFNKALDLFNDVLDSDITPENTLLVFFTPETGLTVYEQLCRTHFPHMLKENYHAPGYFESFIAQAFVNDDFYGILMRSDLSYESFEITEIFLHELSHLFCTRNEIEGGHFFDRYCMGSGEGDGYMNAGYAIWRELVADVMADAVMSDMAVVSLTQVKPVIKQLYSQIRMDNPGAKGNMSRLIAQVMITREVAGTADWNKACRSIARILPPDSSIMQMMLMSVHHKLNQSPFWEITPEFIMELGQMYCDFMATRMLKLKLLKKGR